MLKAVDLRCEYYRNPLGLDTAKPRFGWKIETDRRDFRQGTYHVQVAEKADFSVLRWDSQRVSSDQSQFVEYAGEPLQSRKRYYWRVQVTGTEGEASPWSDTAWFETALLNEPWEAPFIATSLPETGRYPRPQYLRTEIDLENVPESGRVYVTALGLYELWINGQRVSDALLTPGWTSYGKRLAYQTWDVGALLKPGKNAIGAIVGEGWYAGDLTWMNMRNLYGERTALSLSLVVGDRQGKESRFHSDQTWKAGYGPIEYSELYHGERYDARLEDSAWCQVGYNDSSWNKVEIIPFDPSRLVAQEGPLVRKQKKFSAQKLIVTPKGQRVIDFGQNLTGWVAFSARGRRGDRVVLKHAEILDSTGNFYTENMRSARNTIEFILKGEGEERYESHFTFQGFRYVMVEEYPGDIDLSRFEAWAIHSDMESTLEFHCSHEKLNQLHHNIEWGWRGNSVDVPTDCPQRDERLGWTGDAQVFIGTASYLMNVAPFFTKWLRDLASDQLDNGGVPFVIPDILTPVIARDSKITDSHSSTGWGDAATVCPWTIYERYGDRRLLAQQYPSMKAWVEYIRARADKGLLWNTGFHFGDWVALDAKEGSYFGATPNDLTATAYYFYSVTLSARAAEVLRKADDADTYRTLAQDITQAFRKEFFTPSGRLVARTQTAHILALVLGLVPPEHRLRCVADLGALIAENGGHLTTGFLGTPWILRALSENGRLDEAYNLLLKEDFPSWLFQVNMGATTVWEHWDGMKADGTLWSADMNSFNHYAYGAVGQWMYQTIGGLAPDSTSEDGVGWKSALYKPQPGGGLTEGRIGYVSLYGLHSVEWVIRDGRMETVVTVPPNTRATLILPSRGADIQGPEGIIFTDGQDGGRCSLGSGTYRFSCPA